MGFSCSAAAPNVVIDNGTVCSLSERFCAVTVIVSSSPGAAVSAAFAATTAAPHNATAPNHTTPRLPVPMLALPKDKTNYDRSQRRRAMISPGHYVYDSVTKIHPTQFFTCQVGSGLNQGER